MWKVFGRGLLVIAVANLLGCAQQVISIPACVETDPIPNAGDAADDVAIWVNKVRPSESLVLGTNKQAGLHSYDLSGHEQQFLPLGGINNVDIRPNFDFRPDLHQLSQSQDGLVRRYYS